MKTKILLIAALFLSSFGLYAQGGGNDVNEILPFTASGGCQEWVNVTGQFHIVIDAQISAAGVYRGKYHINAKGKGYGEATGAKYEFNDIYLENFHFAAGETYTARERFRVIGQGQLQEFFLNFTFHVTVNANGEITSWIDEFDAGCE